MNNSSKSANFNLLLQAIRLDAPEVAIQKALCIIENNQIDWDDLYVRADFHCVKPQLGSLLSKIPTKLVPAKIRENLKEANLENVYRQMRNLAEFLAVKKLLKDEGIEVVPFKGFWLAHVFYGNLGDRESVDVDLMIHVKDLEKIKAIMAAKGYVPEESVRQLTNDYIVNELCEYNFDQYDGNTRVFHFEFHWRISLSVYAMDIRMEDLKSQITKVTIQNKQFLAFTPSANLLLTVMHHGGKDQFLQLKQVMDIASIIREAKDIDWLWILKEAKRFNVEILVYSGVYISSILTGVEIPEQIKKEVKKKIIQKLGNNRIQMMAETPAKWNSWKHNLNKWNFLIRSRSSLKLKARLIFYEIRKGIIPQLVPKKLHYLFFNKNIRLKTKI